jgi:hypothetical protein
LAGSRAGPRLEISRHSGRRFRPFGRAFFEQAQVPQPAKKREQLAMRHFTAGFGLEDLPDFRKRVGAVSSPAKAEFVGGQDVPLARATIDHRHISARDVGIDITDDVEIGTEPILGTRRRVRRLFGDIAIGRYVRI